MQRRGLLALLVSLLILPFVRFLEEWARPEFRRVVAAGEVVRYSSVRMFIAGEEIHGLREVNWTLGGR